MMKALLFKIIKHQIGGITKMNDRERFLMMKPIQALIDNGKLTDLIIEILAFIDNPELEESILRKARNYKS